MACINRKFRCDWCRANTVTAIAMLVYCFRYVANEHECFVVGERMKKILFLGGVFPEKSKAIIKKSKGNIQNAANVFQWNMIEGLLDLEENNYEVTVYSAPFVGSWPCRFADLCLDANTFEKGCIGGVHVTYIPFFNAPLIKNISRYISCKLYLRKWIKKNITDELYIIAYSAHTPFVAAMSVLKRKYEFVSHLVVPDLPQYMNVSKKQKPLYEVLKTYDIKILYRYLKCVDSFTFLTRKMSDILNVQGKPYVVVEGMVKTRDQCVFSESEKLQEKTVLYTGGMEESYGVKNLVDAAAYFDEGVKLVLCGTGELDAYIKMREREQSNILYMGLVTRQKALELQAHATILTNPRSNDGEYTKYSFPSKNLEYMLWNKPVLVFKLDGIPKEYDDVFLYYNSSEPREMARMVNSVCNLSEKDYNDIGKKTTAFATEKKNARVQMKLVVDCLFISQ